MVNRPRRRPTDSHRLTLQTILSGTLRNALDPLQEGFSDQSMYAALRAVRLIRDPVDASTDSVPNGDSVFESLDSPVAELGKVK